MILYPGTVRYYPGAGVTPGAPYGGALVAGGVGGPAVGQAVHSQWFDASWPVTQGWGPSSYAGEPEGHGYAHWHAGVDVGLACGTIVKMPAGQSGTARWVDNPGGYGTALRIELDHQVLTPAGKGAYMTTKRTFDVWLGHLRQRTVPDGTRLKGGEHLAISNNTGNSTQKLHARGPIGLRELTTYKYVVHGDGQVRE